MMRVKTLFWRQCLYYLALSSTATIKVNTAVIDFHYYLRIFYVRSHVNWKCSRLIYEFTAYLYQAGLRMPKKFNSFFRQDFAVNEIQVRSAVKFTCLNRNNIGVKTVLEIMYRLRNMFLKWVDLSNFYFTVYTHLLILLRKVLISHMYALEYKRSLLGSFSG